MPALNDEQERMELIALRHDINDHSRIITELTQNQRALNNDMDEVKRLEAVRVSEEGHDKEWRQGIEKRLDKVYNLGLWVLGAIGLAGINGIVGFLTERLTQ